MAAVSMYLPTMSIVGKMELEYNIKNKKPVKF